MNACGHHHVGHIGVLGVDKNDSEFYQVTLGGRQGNDRQARQGHRPLLLGRRNARCGRQDHQGLHCRKPRRRRAFPRHLRPHRHRPLQEPRLRRPRPRQGQTLQKRRPHNGSTDQKPDCCGRRLENAGNSPKAKPRKPFALPAGDIIFPFAVWQARKAEIISCHKRIGLLLQPDERVEDIAADLDYFIVIAVNFPKFVDGRGYSTASLLRQRYNYPGELRAVGDVLHDQLFFMQRVGFDAYALKDEKNAVYATGSRIFALQRNLPDLDQPAATALPPPRLRFPPARE
jgi:uncharacterized protein (DUF934 family)